jgi:sugar phosphate isomerase/epimerase
MRRCFPAPAALARVAAVLTMALVIGVGTSRARQRAEPASPFAKDNLHAWAFEEYDAVSRTPAERAQALGRLGVKKAGYIGRNVERMNEFGAYVAAYRAAGIELVAVWTPVNSDAPLQEPHIRMLLDEVTRQKLRVQWWVTLEQFKEAPDDAGLAKAIGIVRTLMAEANTRGLRLALYGHGRDAWFTQPESQLTILDRAGASDAGRPGLVYNFHHAHGQLDRFAQVFPRMLPHLWAVHLNGMKAEGPMILPVGEGDREQEMIRVIAKSGYRGLVGLLHHQRTVDAEKGLARNIDGLRRILLALGESAAAATY